MRPTDLLAHTTAGTRPHDHTHYYSSLSPLLFLVILNSSLSPSLSHLCQFSLPPILLPIFFSPFFFFLTTPFSSPSLSVYISPFTLSISLSPPPLSPPLPLLPSSSPLSSQDMCQMCQENGPPLPLVVN